MTAPSRALPRAAGLLVGFALCGGLVVSGRTPESSERQSALNIGTYAPGDGISVYPAQNFISADNLAPGRDNSAHGSVTLRNGSPTPVAVRTRAFSETDDLDRLLRVQMKVGDQEVFEGKLGRLRRWTARRFKLIPGVLQRIRVRAWLPSSLTDGRQVRVADITFEWKSQEVGW